MYKEKYDYKISLTNPVTRISLHRRLDYGNSNNHSFITLGT